jgi:hypothetical protein
MALAITFKPTGMTSAKYDEVIRRLEAAGAGAPRGRLHHVAYDSGDGLHVVDIWESQETFGAFGQTLIPILQSLGVDPGQPQIAEVHNTIKG